MSEPGNQVFHLKRDGWSGAASCEMAPRGAHNQLNENLFGILKSQVQQSMWNGTDNALTRGLMRDFIVIKKKKRTDHHIAPGMSLGPISIRFHSTSRPLLLLTPGMEVSHNRDNSNCLNTSRNTRVRSSVQFVVLVKFHEGGNQEIVQPSPDTFSG